MAAGSGLDASVAGPDDQAAPVALERPPINVGGRAISEFEAGFFVALMVGEGSFGGDGRQPEISLRMHTDHAAVFRWLMDHMPGGRLYGPYAHGGRRYFQWMARGAYLRDQVVPLLDRYLRPEHSAKVMHRYQLMKEVYGLAAPSGLDPDLYARRRRNAAGSPPPPPALPPLSRRNASLVDTHDPDHDLTGR